MADGSARDRWRRGWRVVLWALALAGCGSKSEPPPPLTVTNVACFVPAGEPREDAMGRGKAMDFDEYGPVMCKFALTKYFRDHPAARIAEVLPLEIPVTPQPYRPPTEPGTQELLVVHADRGPWPRAEELEVYSWGCLDGPSDTFGPRACNGALTQVLRSEKSLPLLIPVNHLTEAKRVLAGTRGLLIVRKRRSPAAPPNRAPAAGPRSGP